MKTSAPSSTAIRGGAGQLIYKLRSAGVIYYRHRYYVNDQAAGFSRTDPSTWQINLPLEATPETKNTSLYAQDSYKPISNLSINYGLRWEKQHVLGRDSSAGFSLNNNLAGRLGVVWDPTNTGKAKIYGNYGRFYENIPQDINIRAFGGELTAFSYNFSPDAANFLPAAGTPSKSTLLGGSSEPVDPNLKGQYLDEFIGGFEYEVMPQTTAGVRIIYRNLGRVIEDFLVPSSGEYFIANPGEGTLGQSLGFYNGGSAPAPQAQRKNKSMELSLRKRYSDNWQFIASYVFSKLEGNYDGHLPELHRQLDPNINSAFDYADFLVNAQGELSNEHKHPGEARWQLCRVKGSPQRSEPRRIVPLAVRSAAHGITATPSRMRTGSYYLTPRGSLGYGPADYETDIHVSYPIKFGSARGEPPAQRLQPVQPSIRNGPRSTLQPDLRRRLRRHPGGAVQRGRRPADDAQHVDAARAARESEGHGHQPGLPEGRNVLHAAAQRADRRPVHVLTRHGSLV